MLFSFSCFLLDPVVDIALSLSLSLVGACPDAVSPNFDFIDETEQTATWETDFHTLLFEQTNDLETVVNHCGLRIII